MLTRIMLVWLWVCYVSSLVSPSLAHAQTTNLNVLDHLRLQDNVNVSNFSNDTSWGTPTSEPSPNPTAAPTPTPVPSGSPSSEPSRPTAVPTDKWVTWIYAPTGPPTQKPSKSPSPTVTTTMTPTVTPTVTPTADPTRKPTVMPTSKLHLIMLTTEKKLRETSVKVGMFAALMLLLPLFAWGAYRLLKWRREKESLLGHVGLTYREQPTFNALTSTACQSLGPMNMSGALSSLQCLSSEGGSNLHSSNHSTCSESGLIGDGSGDGAHMQSTSESAHWA